MACTIHNSKSSNIKENEKEKLENWILETYENSKTILSVHQLQVWSVCKEELVRSDRLSDGYEDFRRRSAGEITQ